MSDVAATSPASPVPRVFRQGGAARRLFQPRTFNKRTRQRFVYDRTCELIAHLGRDPSYPERILIGRVAANEWDLRKLDARLDEGELSDHAARLRLALENRLRLDLKELGFAPRQPAGPSLADIVAEIAASKTGKGGRR